MQASSIIHNIIHSGFSKAIDPTNSIHILSDKSFSLFDYYISNIDDILVFPTSTNNHDYSVSYDILLSNNPIPFSSSIDTLVGLHINSVIYFHNICPNNFKKEDKFLLKNTINQAFKIFPNEYIMNSWSYTIKDKDCIVLPYGIKEPTQQISKTRSVVVLNTNNNPSVNILYNHIRQVFKDASIITDVTDTESHETIRQSAVCIEAESYYNIVYAIANGCYVLSGINYLNEDGLFYIDSYNKIIIEIHKLLESYNINDANNHQTKILQKYYGSDFERSFSNIILNNKIRPYIYAKTS